MDELGMILYFFRARPFKTTYRLSTILVNNCFSRGLFKILFLLFWLHSQGQRDSVLKISGHDSNEFKMTALRPDGDTTFPAFIKVAADPTLTGNGFRKFLVGKNYR